MSPSLRTYDCRETLALARLSRRDYAGPSGQARMKYLKEVSDIPIVRILPSNVFLLILIANFSLTTSNSMDDITVMIYNNRNWTQRCILADEPRSLSRQATT